MDKETDTKETQENEPMEKAINVGIGFEPPAQGLRRPPRMEVKEIVVIHEPEEPLKSERVEEALQAMPDWHVTEEGESITCVKELPTSTVASLYTAYVTALAGARGLPVAVSATEGLVLVTLYGPRNGDCVGSLTESVLDVACLIG
jgi:hypothetical protein